MNSVKVSGINGETHASVVMLAKSKLNITILCEYSVVPQLEKYFTVYYFE